MADVVPFVATRYQTKNSDELGKLLTPPYDVIDAQYQQELYDRHPQNFVRIDFGKDFPDDSEFENRYTRASTAWQEWKNKGILAEDHKKCFYVYEQEFSIPGGKTYRRRGYFAAVRVQDFSEGGIRAHEHTFDGPKADRFRLMRATNTNLSPIFCIYDDPERQIDQLLADAIKDKHPIETEFDGVTQRLWLLCDNKKVEAIEKLMNEQTLYIADGHHRYETSLAFRDEMRRTFRKKDLNQPFDFTMMYLNNIHDEGMIVLPTHRVLSKETIMGTELEEFLEEAQEYFDIKPLELDCTRMDEEAQRVVEELEKAGNKQTSFIMVMPKCRAWLLSLKKHANLDDMIDDDGVPTAVKELDVTILHSYLINRGWLGNPEMELDDEDVHYVKDAADVLRKMQNKKYGVAFIMNPTKLEQVINVAKSGLRMPHKSTYFYPKLVTGLVMRDLNSPW